ncbi:hypothetical protein KJ854_00515, partial [Patescibacteria group bacterium]|nr:hypothetical protein [Patescibacteria group bacterium]
MKITIKSNKGFAPILVILIIIGVLVLGGGAYYFLTNKTQKSGGCTIEVKICPDGSAVGRIGSSCEFTQCPIVKPEEITNFKTYRNEEYEFEFEYPDSFEYETTNDSLGIYINFRSIIKKSPEPIELGPDVSCFVASEDYSLYINVLKENYNRALAQSGAEKLAEEEGSFSKGTWVMRGRQNMPAEAYQITVDNQVGIRSDEVLYGLSYQESEECMGYAGLGSSKRLILSTAKDNYSIVFDEYDSNILDQILSTFKFIK